MTAVFEFTLIFALADAGADPAVHVDGPFEAGCDDATLGVGRPGMLALDFAREGESAAEALASAIRDARRALRGAELVEVAPDLVNLSDIARYLGVTKQNVRKYAAGEARRVKGAFPPPAFSGAPSLWHLYCVTIWFAKHTGLAPKRELIDVAKVAFRENLRIQRRRLAARGDSCFQRGPAQEGSGEGFSMGKILLCGSQSVINILSRNLQEAYPAETAG